MKGWAGRLALRRGNLAKPRRSSSSDMASAAPRRASIAQGCVHKRRLLLGAVFPAPSASPKHPKVILLIS